MMRSCALACLVFNLMSSPKPNDISIRFNENITMSNAVEKH
jgi:hypothetical protein